MSLPLKPHGNRVILIRDPAETRSLGGIVIPDIAQDRPHRGVVIAVGDGLLNAEGINERPAVSLGDEVLYQRDYGTEILIGGREFTIVNGANILCVTGNERDKEQAA